MFDHSVVAVFTVAAVIAEGISILLASLLAMRFARPLAELARAARRLAQGQSHTRVARSVPEEPVSPADPFNQMAERLDEQERHPRAVTDTHDRGARDNRVPARNARGRGRTAAPDGS